MSGHYGSERELAVGVEDELFLVDESTLQLSPVSGDVIAAADAPKDRLKRELYAAQVELTTPVCSGADEAVVLLEDLRQALLECGTTVLAAGLHPSASPGLDASPDEHYRDIIALLGAPTFRTPEAALHVHVAMPDRDTALHAFNGLREHAPLLLALSGSSPLREGLDSGWASARALQIRSYPRWELPRAFASWDDYEATVAAVLTAADAHDATMIWWLLRLQPRLGTVELRVMDAQPSLDAVAGLVALVQGLAADCAEHPRPRPIPAEALNESLFQAARFGMDARLVESSGAVLAASELAAAALARARNALRSLGRDEPLLEVERILRDGTSAQRQRVAYARGGVRAVLEQLVRETACTAARR